MTVSAATNAHEWDAFLIGQRFRPFLQSWTMGEVYREIGQEPVRLEVRENGRIVGICFGHVVPAKRGKHLAIPYGPICEGRIAKGELDIDSQLATRNSQFFPWIDSLKEIAKAHRCSFIRLSPFWTLSDPLNSELCSLSTASPLHLLAEHLWYLPLTKPDLWTSQFAIRNSQFAIRSEDDIFSHFRATHRNLIRRAQKEGVEVGTSDDPERDLPLFLALHEETRKRHGFTAYSDAFFRAQVKHFAAQKVLTLYLARHQGDVLAASIHIHFGGETSYHHGASTAASKIPASHLLQWTAIQDALKRGDHVYNFWGVAPIVESRNEKPFESAQDRRETRTHPFSGVTLFKTGFGGSSLELTHCRDISLSCSYQGTRIFECIRKWRRGF